MRLIDGKVISSYVKDRVKGEVQALKEQGITTGLAVIIVGEDPASKVYVRNKKLGCEQVGFNSSVYELPESMLGREFGRITQLNNLPLTDVPMLLLFDGFGKDAIQ